MAEETKSMPPENDNHTNEFLLKLNSDRMSGLESALERNWIAHLLLAGIGLALVLPIGKFRDLLASYFVKGPYDQTVVATVLLAILLYYFMKLGHLLTLYVEASGLHCGFCRVISETTSMLRGWSFARAQTSTSRHFSR